LIWDCISSGEYRLRRALILCLVIACFSASLAVYMSAMDSLTLKRPGRLGGLHPSQARLLIGAKAVNELTENTLLDLNMFAEFPEPEYRFPDIDAFIVDSTDNIQGA
jgi:hypothetical protein